MKDDVSTKDDVSESQGEISEHKWFLGQPKVYQVWVLTKSKDISQEISRNQDDVTVSHGEISGHKWFLVLARFALPPQYGYTIITNMKTAKKTTWRV